MKYSTYRITNVNTSKMYYGWTNKDPIEKRLRVHFEAAKQGKLLLQNSIRKHGESAFTIELVNTFATQAEATTDEIKLIAEGKTNHCRYPGIGYNMTDGGEGTTGLTRNETQATASRRNIVAYNLSRKGKTYEEIYGDRANAERNKRLHTREPITEVTRAKQANAKLNNSNGSFAVEIIYDTGEVVTYPSRKEAAVKLGVSLATLGNIASGTCWRAGKRVTYKPSVNFTVNLLRTKI